ncbi:hypothetical protein [Psychrobacillus glaciei]|uniref:hypothetical protein n=1 Tax=Psychrobacillus glaciei TaxID=2283160 RepID=UPI00124DB434|nr:hypothetical protein [Psychrobacillus glaciei]
MKKKNSLIFILGLVVGVFTGNGIFIWLGIPTYDQLLEMTLGKPNALNRVIAILVTGVLIYLIYSIPFNIFKRKKKSI